MNTNKFAQRRKELGLTQAKTAQSVGVSRVSISQWEKGETSPKGINLHNLAKVLKCDPNWLLTGQGEPDPIGTTTARTGTFIGDLPEEYRKHYPGKEDTSLKPQYPDLIVLDYYDIEVSAGHGALVVNEEKADQITFSRDFINTVIGVNAKNVFLMPVRGDSMMPTLNNQAMIMVNRVEEFTGDGIYVFRFDGQLMVKRLQFSKTGLTVVSDNTTYKEWELTRAELTTEDFNIIGQVVWAGQRL